MTHTTLTLIPAKAASTRLKNKNMQLLGGKPLLQWAIDSVTASNIVSDIYVSTESQHIADYVAKQQGVKSIIRPEKLAVDPAGVVDVALHALEMLTSQKKYYDTLIILLPTCPFRTGENIEAAYELFMTNNAKFLMSVSEYSHTPFAAMYLDGALIKPYFPEFIGNKSQEMPKAYRANGAIHIVDVEAFIASKSYYTQPLTAYIMSHESSIDIDNQTDLDYAESLLN